jgi:hydroxymethylpyrimidine pyrophosphatase-like HAD family hydrolase
MTKKRSIIHYIDFGIFPGGVLFTNGFDVDGLKKELKRQKTDEWLNAFLIEEEFFSKANYAYAKVIQEKKGKEANFFFLFTKEQFRFTDEEYIKLAHECLHICQCFLIDILDRNKESEAEAYLHSHLMNECLSVLRSKTK